MLYSFLKGASLCVLVLGTAFTAHASQDNRLSGQEIKQTITGKRIYLQTPFGGEFPLYYRANGKVDGTGEALGLGRVMQPEDEGQWWVSGNQLCQQWQEWYDGKRYCFELSQTGPATLNWYRDDGKSGKARIGE
jgi:hypothetical protein